MSTNKLSPGKGWVLCKPVALSSSSGGLCTTAPQGRSTALDRPWPGEPPLPLSQVPPGPSPPTQGLEHLQVSRMMEH